jgi:pantoate--beta-alanine ligase
MKVISSVAELQHELGSFDKEQVALVPTIGCLHEGHVSLIEKATRLADIVVVSIYVNPTQFAQGEDLAIYPRPLDKDLAICEEQGVDFVFHPDNLYPEDGAQVSLSVGALSQRLCGETRKGHFDGVASVVNMLFNIVNPHIAIFGEKDFQQLTIIQRMVSDLYMSVEVIGAGTVREVDGLAKSSRNTYLSEQERKQAAEISAALKLMQYAAANGISLEKALDKAHQHLQRFDIKPEYLEVCFADSLLPADSFATNKPLRALIAANIGATRLIDNMPLCPASSHQISEDNPLCA